MTVRIGVDVGGTFTKAVAVDVDTGEVAGRAVIATTHHHGDGVAAGVVAVVKELTEQVGADQVELVTHSTTQAVNALLEGDVALVGMVGMGAAPDLRKARRRTTDPRITLTEGRRLPVTSEFIDVTQGLDAAVADQVVARLRAAGARSVAAAAAYSPDDASNEQAVAAAARRAGLPVTTSAELTGLYGLELRAVTAALNASILPIALQTARTVQAGVAAAGVTSPVMVMRGDAGATDLDTFQRMPARTLYSGPAASVAGAVRSESIADGVIVEVGGTSTNIAAIRRGQPSLSYVKVASHATAIRALDVQVAGVAGGSMLRVRRNHVYGVGPRSAHIAGLPYCCFLSEADFVDATPEPIAPRPDDPPDYLVVRGGDGMRAALTLTCAANLLGIVADSDYARGDAAAAHAAFTAAGRALGLPAEELARRMLQAATQALGDIVTDVAKAHKLTRPVLVAVGGGAGGLGRALASAMELPIVIPPQAEVISAVGDALSLVRVERERTLTAPTALDVARLVADAEAEAVAAGAAAASLEARVEHIAERDTLRVVCTGAVALTAGARTGRPPASAEQAAAATHTLGAQQPPERVGQFWVAADAHRRSVVVLDRYADLLLDVVGERVDGSATPDEIHACLQRCARGRGAMASAADTWLISGHRFVQLPDTDAAAIHQAVTALSTSTAVLVIGTER